MAWLVEAIWAFSKNHPEVLLAIAVFLLLPLVIQDPNLPFNWPIFGRLPYLLSNVHRLHDLCTEVLETNGGTFLFKAPVAGEDILLTCDPANVNHVFNMNFSNYPKGDDYGDIFDVFGGGIFNSDEESWKVQRTLAHNFIHGARFKSFMAKASRDKVRDGLVPLLEHMCRHGEVVDLQDVFMRFTFDATSLLVFGIDPGCLSTEFPTVPFAKAIDSIEEILISRHVLPKRWWKMMSWLNVGKEKKFTMARKVMHDSIAEYIAARRNEKGRSIVDNDDDDGGMDLLSSYLEYVEDKSGGGDDNINDKFLHDTTLNLVIAGRDTTSAALSWLFWLISENPSVEAKILKELNTCIRNKPEVCGDDQLSTLPVVFEAAELAKLVYLHAVLCESLRLFPPVPFEHKGVLKPDVLPSGAPVHRRTRLLFSLYAMGRMKSVWGKDCCEFRPERWISDRGTIRHVPSYKFLSFNAGPRSCLGKNVAFTQMKVVAAAMLFNFEVEVVNKQEVLPKISIILHMKNGMMVRVRRRRAAK